MEQTLKQILKVIKQQESTISMVLGLFVVVIIVTLIYTHYQQSSKSASISSLAESTDSAQLQLAAPPTNLPIIQHTVAKGEHLWKIAETYYQDGYRWVEVAKANNLTNANQLTVGQKLVIPQTAPTLVPVTPVSNLVSVPNHYTVKPGDTLWNIAKVHYRDGHQWVKIMDANKQLLKNSSIIEVGWDLSLPQ